MLLAERLQTLTKPERVEWLAGLTPEQRQDAIERVRWELQPVLDPLREWGWRQWLAEIRPEAFGAGGSPFADFHVPAWEWVWSITRDGPTPPPYLAVWFRGGAKSTWAETAVARLGMTGARRYCLYVSGTQLQADDHVDEIAGLLESRAVARHYPDMADRAVGKHGNAKGWRRNRLRTKSGFTVDALGLDQKSRGKKLDDARPDVLVLDDVDDAADSATAVANKLRSITTKIIPSLAENAVILVAQNLIHRGGIVAKIGSHEVDILQHGTFNGPIPAILDLDVELGDDRLWRVTGGTPTWVGYGLNRAEKAIQDMGYGAFMMEVQQEVDEKPGALLTKAIIDEGRIPRGEVPELDRIIVGIDPNKTGRGDDAGIVVVGRATIRGVRHAYVLDDLSQLSAPSEWRDPAVRSAQDWNAGGLAVEHAGLGEHAKLTLEGSPLWADRPLPIYTAEANLGKFDRARPIAQFYREGRVHHVGRHPYLEGQWTSWDPNEDRVSPGAIDAVVHAITHLLIDNTGPARASWV